MPNAQGSRLNANDKRFVASLVFYVVVTAFLGRDVLAHLSTGIANDAGDPLFTAAILHWNARVLPLTHAWWQFPIFYPTADALAFSEHLLGVSVIATPISWITNDANVTYNIVALLTFPLCASAMYTLVRRLTGSSAGAFVSGLAFGFSPYRISQLPHIQMLATFWAPLALFGLHVYIESGKRRWLVLYGVAWLLQAAANGYSLFFFSILIGFWVLWFVVAKRRWRALAEIALATTIALLPLIPILFTYVNVHARHGFERSLEEIQFFSADVAAMLCASPQLALWGRLQTACRPEGELFPGAVVFVLLILAFAALMGWIGGGMPRTSRVVTVLRRLALVVALVSAWAVIARMVFGPWRIEFGFLRASSSSIARPIVIGLGALVVALVASRGVLVAARRSSTLAFYVIGALITWALALGPTINFMGKPTGYAGPFALILLLPGVDSLRAPARFWLMTTLCLAVIGGFVVSKLLQGRGRGSGAVLLGVISMGVLADGWVDRVVSVPQADPAPNAMMLRGEVVLSLPGGDVRDVLPVYQAVVGGWKSVNGYSGYGPSYYQAIQYGVRAELDELFEAFRVEQDLHVLVPSDAPRLKALVERQPGAVMTARSRSRIQYRLPRQVMSRPTSSGVKLAIQQIDSSCSAAVVSKVIDGDLSSRWYCGAQNGDEVLTADLGQVRDVGAVVHALGRYASEFPRELVIETSVDGSSWQQAWKGSPIAEVIRGALENPKSPSVVVSFDPRSARYVRLRQTARDDQFYWSVPELEIQGPPARR